MQQVGLPEAAKAYVALAGAIATALLGVYAADTEVGKVLTVISVIATAVATWAVPNKPAPASRGGMRVKRNEFGHVSGPYGGAFWLIVAIAVMVFLILLAAFGVINA